ncbi:MFS transporter [Mycobacterium haemophilum]|uniref:MFS transporter n=1 Tax=Mycobacterium haemophilum TaxID=29311 RepID=A0A0I9TGW6_9MYCO|nr:MFS transporter [Mycobacterium haemophilum]AKN18749.1 MFS transporter [Mycobacterium haemophilum DSM 44634]KLO27788.1 MFS transporter [Mycobacterium haemophilum]KLO35296.1 MFS transporter [Mycobacterium haemophilum]KLO40307.1 MFS transporter [Mycobacterium haemophilum]KLO47581.1 MFS transporter [Mycobacterium haemophilum]
MVATGVLVDRKTARQAVKSSFLGTSAEWYDYFLYGSAAAIVFPHVFFAEMGSTVGTLTSLASFGVAFFFRPLGGLIFGQIGDRVSRKFALVATLLMMGIGTFLIGCLPPSTQIGVAAPIILVILRITQGIALGGEWGGGTLVVMESAPTDKRGLYAVSTQLGVPAGQLASAGMLAVFGLLPNEQFFGWGWRIPFLSSALIVWAGLYIRLKQEEAPRFQEIRQRGDMVRKPIAEVWNHKKKVTLLLIFVQFASTIGYFLFTVYSLVYVTKDLNISRSVPLTGVFVGAALCLVVMPFYAALSDRYGRRPIYALGVLIIGFYAIPFFYLLNTRNHVVIIVAIAAGLVFGWAPPGSIQGPVYSEQYPTRYRYTGCSIAYQCSSVVSGAPAPAIAGILVNAAETTLAVSWYIIVGAAISLACVFALRETYRADLSEA